MEAGLGGQTQNFYGPVVPDLTGFGKRSLDWDLNDWKWDGDLFTASPLSSVPYKSVPPDCRYRQLFPVGTETHVHTGLSKYPSYRSEDAETGNVERKREMEKRRRAVGSENGEFQDEAGSLNLKLGGESFPIVDEDGKGGKKLKIAGNSSHRAVCQVDDCRADLSNAKDYHRRHKVCDMHSKASRALVGNVMQRFCQQCSRFHLLQEFDEGKRSCRRRLAGHNRRRRKTHPDTTANNESANDGHSSSYLLISLLRILSNMHSNHSDQAKDQDVLSHLLKNLANLTGTVTEKNIPALLQGSQASLSAGLPSGAQQKVLNMNIREPEPAMPSGSASRASDLQNRLSFTEHGAAGPASISEQKRICTDSAMVGSPQGLQSDDIFTLREGAPVNANGSDARVGRNRLNSIDLNTAYDDSLDCVEEVDRMPVPVTPTTDTLNFPSPLQHDSQKSSSLQTSRNSDSNSTLSPSSSGGEAQTRTDRIVFKLFGKEPNDFPIVLRTQILDWLSHSPTDIESYIRPGCIILTIYLRLGKQSWEELCSDLGYSLKRLLDSSDDTFWKMGWVYTRVQDSVAFICNGRVVLDTHLPLKNYRSCKVSSIKPIAVPVSEKAQFVVKGFNLCHSTTRLLCALEGTYLLQGSCDLLEDTDLSNDHNGLQCLSFSCTIPNVTGRGFVEVEDNGLSSSFLPFIVAEQEVCSEICMLEDAFELPDNGDDGEEKSREVRLRDQALEFIHEMGWLLHRNQVRFRLGGQDPNLCLFSFNRFRWLLEFSMDHDWCAVVKKLLCILFEGSIEPGENASPELALREMGLLHKAVRRNCKPMVELLLRFSPNKSLDKQALEQEEHVDSGQSSLFRPDAAGPAGLTPLHLAACTDGLEDVLDALTDGPGSVGIQAWRTVRDEMGFTPNDYACLRGHYSYIHLVQRKIKKSESVHVVDIPAALIGATAKPKQSEENKTAKLTSFQVEKPDIGTTNKQCRICEHKMVYGNLKTSLAYRPAMLSLVAIAAVCVCVALLFKSSPEVYVFQPFRWERLKYGSM